MSDVDGGLRKLAADLSTAGERVGAKVAKVIRDTTRDVAATSRGLAPVDSGRLRDSIETEIVGDGRFANIRGYVGATVPYGHLVEFGTVRSSPQPFLLPALDAHRDEFDKGIRDAVGDIL